MTEPVVVIDSLSHTFARAHGAPPQVALDGVSAAIEPGTITGLVGPDAAGKRPPCFA
jgi:ABC-type multidrug transport system ATPase subunit